MQLRCLYGGQCQDSDGTRGRTRSERTHCQTTPNDHHCWEEVTRLSVTKGKVVRNLSAEAKKLALACKRWSDVLVLTLLEKRTRYSPH